MSVAVKWKACWIQMAELLRMVQSQDLFYLETQERLGFGWIVISTEMTWTM